MSRLLVVAEQIRPKGIFLGFMNLRKHARKGHLQRWEKRPSHMRIHLQIWDKHTAPMQVHLHRWWKRLPTWLKAYPTIPTPQALTTRPQNKLFMGYEWLCRNYDQHIHLYKGCEPMKFLALCSPKIKYPHPWYQLLEKEFRDLRIRYMCC